MLFYHGSSGFSVYTYKVAERLEAGGCLTECKNRFAAFVLKALPMLARMDLPPICLRMYIVISYTATLSLFPAGSRCKFFGIAMNT